MAFCFLLKIINEHFDSNKLAVQKKQLRICFATFTSITILLIVALLVLEFKPYILGDKTVFYSFLFPPITELPALSVILYFHHINYATEKPGQTQNLSRVSI